MICTLGKINIVASIGMILSEGIYFRKNYDFMDEILKLS